MRAGKIPPLILQQQILPFTGAKRPEVLVGPKFGEDCSVLDFGDYLIVLSTDPITGAIAGLGSLAVHVSCNDVAASGAKPIGLLLTIFLPEGSTEAMLSKLVQEINQTATQMNVAILGGHTEVTAAVKQVVVAVTAVGKVCRKHLVTSSGAKPGDDIILTKTAGLEGTAIICADLARELKNLLPPEVLRDAQILRKQLSVVPEGIIAAQAGASAMHDVTEGGVRGALAELAHASKVGVEVWAEKIPLAPETKILCQCLAIDPLGLISSGSMLITAPPKSTVLAALAEANIPASVIGKVQSHSELFLCRNGKWETITIPERDELYNVLDRFSADP